MKKHLHNIQGFTLIEVLIVVAILGTLAAIAMPMFSQYRMRAFNTAAESDVRNTKSAEELLMTDALVYGRSEQSTLIAAKGEHGAGTPVAGPLAGASSLGFGALLAGKDNTPEHKVRAVGFGLSNGVTLQADTLTDGPTFIVYAHHVQGNRGYATETDTTAVLVCENDKWIGKPGIQVTPVMPEAMKVAAEDLRGKDCGGAAGQIQQWRIL